MDGTAEKTILIVDDEPAAAAELGAALEEHGYGVVTVRNGFKAVERVVDLPSIDLVLLDLDLGDGISGVEVGEAILELRELPVVFLSSGAEDELLPNAEMLPAYGYLRKDCGQAMLCATVRTALSVFDTRPREPGDDGCGAEDLLWQVVDQMPYPVVICDTAGTLTTANRAFLDMAGIADRDALGERYNVFTELLAAERADLKDEIDRVYAGERVHIPELVIPRDGRLQPEDAHDYDSVVQELTMSPVFGGQGEIAHIAIIWKDISAYKHAAERLDETRRQLQSVLDTQEELICRFTPDLTLTYVNDAYCRAFALKADDLIGTSFLSLIPECDHETVRSNVAKLSYEQRASVTYEHTVDGPDGELRWQRWTDYRLLGSEGRLREIQSVGRDVTDRKLAEQDLERQSALIEALICTLDEMVFVKDPAGVWLRCNEACAQYVGLPVEEIIGRTDYELFEPERAEYFRSQDRRVWQVGERQTFEEWARFPDGREVLLETTKIPYRAASGEAAGIIGISRVSRRG